MFLRGFGVGCAIMTALWLWFRQKNNSTRPVLHDVVMHDINRVAIDNRAAQVLRDIQKEQSWILNPSVKPSTDS